MKTKLLSIVLLSLFSLQLKSQDTVVVRQKPKFIGFSPKKYSDDSVNGINLGIMDDYDSQKINGINLQFSPLGLIYPLIPTALPVPTSENSTVTVNGLHISTGGMADGKKVNGMSISLYHHAMTTNGISATFYNNTSGSLNGIHISGFANNADRGNGINIALMGNNAQKFNGLQISAFNEAEDMKGLQIGLINKSAKLKGIQIGLWNKNERRNLPLINWNFKLEKKRKKTNQHRQTSE